MDLFNNGLFENTRIYLSGNFNTPKKQLIEKLEGEGAIMRTINDNGIFQLLGITKHTCVIVKGNNISTKDQEKIDLLISDGYNIPIISESELNDILLGKSYREFKEVDKNINITYDLIYSSKYNKTEHLDFNEVTHNLGQKEIFIFKCKENKDTLLQSLGNIGAYPSDDFVPKTTNYCWVTKDTIDKLKIGVKDDFIKLIEDTYNGSDSTKFTYKFIFESEVIYWIECRSERVHDNITLGLIKRYKESINNKLK